MVSNHDPAVIMKDARAYAFEVKHATPWSRLTFIGSGSVEVFSCTGWTLLVCLPRRVGPYSHQSE